MLQLRNGNELVIDSSDPWEGRGPITSAFSCTILVFVFSKLQVNKVLLYSGFDIFLKHREVNSLSLHMLKDYSQKSISLLFCLEGQNSNWHAGRCFFFGMFTQVFCSETGNQHLSDCNPVAIRQPGSLYPGMLSSTVMTSLMRRSLWTLSFCLCTHQCTQQLHAAQPSFLRTHLSW